MNFAKLPAFSVGCGDTIIAKLIVHREDMEVIDLHYSRLQCLISHRQLGTMTFASESHQIQHIALQSTH